LRGSLLHTQIRTEEHLILTPTLSIHLTPSIHLTLSIHLTPYPSLTPLLSHPHMPLPYLALLYLSNPPYPSIQSALSLYPFHPSIHPTPYPSIFSSTLSSPYSPSLPCPVIPIQHPLSTPTFLLYSIIPSYINISVRSIPPPLSISPPSIHLTLLYLSLLGVGGAY